jgi:hypothetical protein
MCGRHVVKITHKCRDKIATYKTHFQDCSLSRLCTRTLAKRGGLKRKINQIRQKQCNADVYIIKRSAKAHVMSMRSHNGVIIMLSLLVRLRVDIHCYNTTYNTTYSDDSCGRFTNAFSLTNDIGFCSMRLKYNFTLESSNIVR